MSSLFCSSPAIALADSAVLTQLGEDKEHEYNSHRIFGSIGWGATMFVMGMVLDHSRIFQDAKCEPNEGQRNYNVCFFVFATLMGIAFVVASALPFKYKEQKKHEIPSQVNGGPQQPPTTVGSA